MISRFAWTLALLVTLPSAQAGDSVPPQYLEPYQACLVTDSGALPVALEQASGPMEHRYGLMERTSLPEDHGMLFLYPSERGANAGFWMYRTRIALDIAWLDENGVILATDTMVPCDTASPRDCPSWSPGIRHRNVLEMNAGFFSRHHVNVGDKLVVNLNDNIDCPPAD